MAIPVLCDCGKSYRLKDEFAGRRVKCRECGVTLQVPTVALADEPILAAEIVEAVPVAKLAKSSDEQRQLQAELEYSRQTSNTAASNPGMFRVSYLRWIRAFPKWVIIWHSLLVLSLVLTVLVHWAFGILFLMLAYAVYIYWHRVKYQFISGCVNPGQVVSIHPPLVAVVTDLTKGGPSCLVAKVVRQPLSCMAGGPPQIGQRVATVAFYNEVNSGLDHWDDFEPVVADCVTGNHDDLARVLASIDQESWQELQTAIPQIPTPPQPGLYRIYTPQDAARPLLAAPADIAMLINQYLDGESYCHLAAQGIKPEVMLQAQTYVPAQVMANIVALVESSHHSSDAKEGLALTNAEVLYRFENIGRGSFRYEELAGAFCFSKGLELAFKTGQRILLPKAHFLSGTQVALDRLFNAIIHAE